ncbi:hypothetical protein Pmani_004369 [Petrolisthes manimaculis]|uniref:Uncharacterized protein n=1 Tax=Petrolisthes manimaculis TaxID=1843537 RepID=A0AAE1UP19_9EUCA|nr:hypothetical protein Pmani_004369 [Petrolisthes manimaculis]
MKKCVPAHTYFENIKRKTIIRTHITRSHMTLSSPSEKVDSMPNSICNGNQQFTRLCNDNPVGLNHSCSNSIEGQRESLSTLLSKHQPEGNLSVGKPNQRKHEKLNIASA